MVCLAVALANGYSSEVVVLISGINDYSILPSVQKKSHSIKWSLVAFPFTKSKK
jgi:hypothetical protein